jgi:hypothetical protein
MLTEDKSVSYRFCLGAGLAAPRFFGCVAAPAREASPSAIAWLQEHAARRYITEHLTGLRLCEPDDFAEFLVPRVGELEHGAVIGLTPLVEGRRVIPHTFAPRR